MDEILVNEMTDNGLIFETYKQLIQFNILKKTTIQFLKMGREQNTYFSKENIRRLIGP